MGKLLGHIWATTAREYGVKQAVSSQPRALRINTGYNSDMPGSHEVESSNLSRSTITLEDSRTCACDGERACFYCAKKQLLGKLFQKSSVISRLMVAGAHRTAEPRHRTGPESSGVDAMELPACTATDRYNSPSRLDPFEVQYVPPGRNPQIVAREESHSEKAEKHASNEAKSGRVFGH
jgi:hypothetical protein